MSVWRDGRAEPDSACEDALDRGALLGDGLFETVFVADGAAPLLAAHLGRMRRSAEHLGLGCPDDADALVARALPALWRAEASPRRAALRLTLSAGGGRGLDRPGASAVRLTVSLARLPDVADPSPLRVVTATCHRVDPRSALAGHKTLSWLGFVLARREARARGADAALLETVDGDVCEADHANLFALVDGSVVTPPPDRGVLPGVTRARALDALRAAGHTVAERPLRHEELSRAAEVWLTSSLRGVVGVASVDARALAAPGPLTAWLAACVPPGGTAAAGAGLAPTQRPGARL